MTPSFPGTVARRRRTLVTGVSLGLLATAAGVVYYILVGRSLIAAVVTTWYVFESAFAPVRLPSTPRRRLVFVYVVPRVVGTAVALVLAGMLGLPWDQTTVLAYILLLILESLYRLALRLIYPARGMTDDARADHPGEGHTHACRQALPDAGRVLFAWFFVVALPLTLYAYGARQVLSDARFYVAQFEQLGLYEQALDPVGEILIDTARGQSGNVRRAVGLLSEEDVRLAVQTLLPEAWTTALVEQALGATLSWLETGAGQRVPSITVPVADIQRHLQDATSELFDRHAADRPICMPGGPPSAFCRPQGMSAAAYAATYKPEAMGIVTGIFALIPAELDLATAVTMSPQTFQEPLAFLEKAGQGLQNLDRVLAWAGAACALALAALWSLSVLSGRRPVLWAGAALCAAGIGAWVASWTLAMLGSTGILARTAVRILGNPADLLTVLGLQMLGGFAREVHALVSPVELLLAGTGAVTAFAHLSTSVPGRRRSSSRSVRASVVVLAAGSLLWSQYVAIGERSYQQAVRAHRAGELAEALPLYRALDRAYPFVVGDFVRRVRSGLREGERYMAASAAYQAGDYASAVHGYEALLVGNPSIAVRESAESDLEGALYAWAESLRAAGEYERALDRYRHVRDALRARDVDERMAELYLDWGDALLVGGDFAGAIATYGRMGYDVSDPRLWRDADGQRILAYCDWQASLRADGDAARADGVCTELLTAYPGAGDRCPDCGRAP